MSAEATLTVALICIALLPLLAVWGRVHIPHRAAWGGVVALWLAMPVTLIWAGLTYWQPVATLPPPDNRPLQTAMDGFVGSDTCRTCHLKEHRTWHASYHRTMTQVATPETVLAPFDNVSLKDGIEYTAIRRGDQFSVMLPYPYEERPIVTTTGSHHMQVYWFPPHDGSRYLGLVPFAYLKDEDRWLPRRALFLQPPGAQTEFRLGQWNEACIQCHATHGKMNPTIRSDGNWASDEVDSRVAELGISCEACHGPGQRHVQANRNPARRYAHHLRGQPDDTIVNPRRLPHDLSSQVCGHCHSITGVDKWREWAAGGSDYRPGENLYDAEIRFLVDYNADPLRSEVEFLRDERPDFFSDHFWPDTTVRVSGREYNGLLESPCYQRGEMSCLSCHDMHPGTDDPRQLTEWADDQLHHQMQGDHACTQCHQDYANESAMVAHTHHPAASSGSRCYNCHMPYTAYGLLKGIRSHRVETPSVATSLATGRPNGCNQCHIDKSLQWAAENLLQWYDIEAPELSEDEQTVAASVLWMLKGDAAQRALMAWTFGWDEAQATAGTDWLPPYLIQLLEDPYQAVRLIASRSLRKLAGFSDFVFECPTTDEKLAADIRRGLTIWDSLPKAPSAAVLIDEDGQLMQEPFLRLLKQRDDRNVNVAE